MWGLLCFFSFVSSSALGFGPHVFAEDHFLWSLISNHFWWFFIKLWWMQEYLQSLYRPAPWSQAYMSSGALLYFPSPSQNSAVLKSAELRSQNAAGPDTNPSGPCKICSDYQSVPWMFWTSRLHLHEVLKNELCCHCQLLWLGNSLTWLCSPAAPSGCAGTCG